MFIRNPYNYSMDDVSFDTGLICPEPTLAQQQFKEECDINTIMERFGVTGVLPESVRMPMYGDFTGINNLQDALAAMQAADDSFAAMPAKVRDRFGNNASKFVDFCLDESNREEAIKLGLIPDLPLDVNGTATDANAP